MYFGYGTRSGEPWGGSVAIYTTGIDTVNTVEDPGIGDSELGEYYAVFFGQGADGNMFKITKSGKLNTPDGYSGWDSPWLMISKQSANINGVPTTSFETLQSKQNIVSTSDVFKIYRKDGIDLTEMVSSANDHKFHIEKIYSSGSVMYDAPMNCKMVGVGSTEESSLINLKFVRNISDGSYAKCFNVSQMFINKILTETVCMSDTIFDLRNDYDSTIITGLSYKSLVKISDIDYAMIFEYPTQTGTKNLVLTTENFDTYISNNTGKLGIFMDSNIADINTNANTISPIDSDLVNSSTFSSYINFNYTTPPTTASEAMFFKYLMTDAFIDHNKILLTKIFWITQTDMSVVAPGSGWTVKTIDGRVYYTKPVTTNDSTPEYYNIGNILVDINLSDDFAFDFANKYDLKRVGNDYRIKNGINSESYSLASDRFKLREIVLYYKNTANKFVPIYYARSNVSINNNGSYTFQIII
jgi:hypothetical protein